MRKKNSKKKREKWKMRKRNLNLSIFSKGPSSEPHMLVVPSTFQKQPEKSYFRITISWTRFSLNSLTYSSITFTYTHTHTKNSISCLVFALILLVTFPISMLIAKSHEDPNLKCTDKWEICTWCLIKNSYTKVYWLLTLVIGNVTNT